MEGTSYSCICFFKTGLLGNSILHSIPSNELEKPQRLQNIAARLTVRAKTSAHITPPTLLVTYKILHGFSPTYLNELLFNYTPHSFSTVKQLKLLSIPKTRTVTYGDRSFSVIAPKLWNDLPHYNQTVLHS